MGPRFFLGCSPAHHGHVLRSHRNGKSIETCDTPMETLAASVGFFLARNRGPHSICLPDALFPSGVSLARWTPRLPIRPLFGSCKPPTPCVCSFLDILPPRVPARALPWEAFLLGALAEKPFFRLSEAPANYYSPDHQNAINVAVAHKFPQCLRRVHLRANHILHCG